jgi:hypothetical protein
MKRRREECPRRRVRRRVHTRSVRPNPLSTSPSNPILGSGRFTAAEVSPINVDDFDRMGPIPRKKHKKGGRCCRFNFLTRFQFENKFQYATSIEPQYGGCHITYPIATKETARTTTRQYRGGRYKSFGGWHTQCTSSFVGFIEWIRASRLNGYNPKNRRTCQWLRGE